MNLKQIVKRITETRHVADMANLHKDATGINVIITATSKMPRHKPRVKVRKNLKESFSLSIEDEPKLLAGSTSIVTPKELEPVKQWIFLNKDILLEYWNDELFNTKRLYTETKKVE